MLFSRFVQQPEESSVRGVPDLFAAWRRNMLIGHLLCHGPQHHLRQISSRFSCSLLDHRHSVLIVNPCLCIKCRRIRRLPASGKAGYACRPRRQSIKVMICSIPFRILQAEMFHFVLSMLRKPVFVFRRDLRSDYGSHLFSSNHLYWVSVPALEVHAVQKHKKPSRFLI